MNRIILVAFTLALVQPSISIFSEDLDEESLYGYFSGTYRLLGKKVDSAETYFGKIILTTKGDYLEVRRIIKGVEVKGTGKIEYLAYEKIPVLRIRFREKGVEYEGEYTWSNDFDNYPRISGFVTVKGKETDDPGLEVLFVIHEK